jgi:putative RNA 2'-phosphotransferase
MAGGDVGASKKLSFWLRHRPDAAGLTLDEAGWTEVDAVLGALDRAGVTGGLDRLRGVVAGNDKQRFELSADGRRIRARQGHSVAVELGWSEQVPPDRLYHGTVARFLDAILAEGLRPMGRHHVHLSPDIATARRVGGRRGAPAILAVRARDLHAAGKPFYRTANQVWLVDAVPPQFLELVEGAGGTFTGAG